jgi:hypothetical protein
MGEFPCRTKEISGTDYIVKMYLVSDGSLRMSTTRYSEEDAQKYIDRMKASLGDKYRYEVTPRPWTQRVCIECGKEDW